MVCTTLTVIQAVAPPKPTIFNYCWKIGTRTGSCPMPTEVPAVKAGSVISITADIANSGPVGRVNVIFKIDGVATFNDTNVSLGSYPGGGLWSPTFSGYTMPTKNVVLTIEAYGWDATKSAWILGSTRTTTISTVSAGCTGIDLVPFAASIKTGGIVDMVASINPGNVPFTVTFKDRAGIVLGSCKTSGTGTATGSSTCPFTWNSVTHGGNKAGTYYVKAYADSCLSTESAIVVDAPILQYNFNITVTDSKIGTAVPGATVLIATAGGASQSKVTDTNGLASFRTDSGTISISISKNGYNTYNTAEYVYMDKSITYSIDPIPPIPTTGNIQFVSVPTGADIFIDGKPVAPLGAKTPITIMDIPAGDHAWALRLIGYNESSSRVIVPSGGTTSVYATLTPATPTAGSLNITSHPVMGAAVWIDGKDTKLITSGATTVTNIPPGTHSYVLIIPGFTDAKGNFDIKVGQTTYLDVALVPIATIGVLEISSDPSGARVFRDDIDTKRVTPATIINLAEGDHTYKVILSGYKDISATFTIKAGETTKVHLILEKSGLGTETLILAGIAGLATLALLKKE